MHNTQDQKKLDSLTREEKLALTTVQAFRNRWTLLYDLSCWYITKNEMMHEDRWDLQLILRKKEVSCFEKQAVEFQLIIDSCVWLYIKRHAKSETSVDREHRHIYN